MFIWLMLTIALNLLVVSALTSRRFQAWLFRARRKPQRPSAEYSQRPCNAPAEGVPGPRRGPR
jgi:hypothetical protein